MKRKLRGLLSVLTSVVLLLGLGFSVSADNEISNATPVTLGETYRGVLGDECSQFFEFNLQESSRVTFNFENDSSSQRFEIYDSDGTKFYITKSYSNVLGFIKTSFYYDLTAGTYYCSLKNSFGLNKDNFTGKYSIAFNADSANETFKETGSGNNNIAKNANTIELDKEYQGQIAMNDSADYYKFSLKESSSIYLSGESDFFIDVSLYDADGKQVYDYPYHIKTKDSGNVKIDDTEYNLIAGDYYLRIYSSEKQYGNYSFKLDSKPVCSFTPEFNKQTNNSKATAGEIELNNKEYVGHIAKNNQMDCYKFTVNQNTSFDISFTGIEVDCTLYDSDDHKMVESQIRQNNRSISTDLIPGIYYLVVERGSSQNGVYTFTFTGCVHSYIITINKAIPNRNGSRKTECTKCKKVNENSIIYAPSRIVLSCSDFVYNGSSFMPSVTVYDSNTKVISSSNYSVSYGNNKNVGSGYVKVIFSSDEYEGELCANFVIRPQKISLKKAKSSKNKIITAWKKKTGASGYEVQIGRRKKSSNSGYCYTNYKTVKLVKNKTTWIIKGVKKHNTYGVRIRYFKTIKGTKYYSDYSNWKNVKVK